MMDKTSRIAVFDSGMGGISVLKELLKVMPNEHYLFFGDSKNAPYGKKSQAEIQRLCLKWADYFKEKQCKAIVVACNTATSAAIHLLREKITDIPIIGIEPAVKPAVLHDYGVLNRRKRILVMATPVTLRGKKYQQLIKQYEASADIIDVAAPSIVGFVEKGDIESAELIDYLHEVLDIHLKEPIDAVVLGCTHFPFVKKAIHEIVGDSVLFFDGAEGSSRQAKRQLEAFGLLSDSNEKGTVLFENSDESGIQKELSRKLLNMEIEK